MNQYQACLDSFECIFHKDSKCSNQITECWHILPNVLHFGLVVCSRPPHCKCVKHENMRCIIAKMTQHGHFSNQKRGGGEISNRQFSDPRWYRNTIPPYNCPLPPCPSDQNKPLYIQWEQEIYVTHPSNQNRPVVSKCHFHNNINNKNLQTKYSK